MFNYIRAAAAFPRSRTADTKHNAGEIIRVAKECVSLGARILVLPQNAITGEGCGDLLRQDALLRGAEEAKKRIADEVRDLGLDVYTGCNRITADDEIDLCNLGINAVSLTRPSEAGGWKRVRECYLTLSGINGCVYILASSGPDETVTEGVYGGGLLICGNGRVLAERPALSSGQNFITADIDLDLLSGACQDDTVNGTYIIENRITSPLSQPVSANPFFPDDKADYPAFCADILNIQKNALARRISHTGAERAVINVSGGLDSALALLVTAGAMDLLERARADILALFLPGFGTTRRTTANARLLIQALGADTREIDIKPACLQHFKDIGLDPNNPNVVYENAQARERTQIALDIANMEGGLMVGTGNMSELALGFTTFGGDLLSAYNPNCGLTKTAVREVVKWAAHSELFGTDAAKALLDILNTPISPELLPPSDGKITQITEETVGPYELIDFFLYHMIKNGFAPDKISFLANTAFNGKYTLETINHWLKSFIKRFFANQFKRISAPEGPAVLGISLSPRGGFSMPGDANANCWLEQ